MLAELILEESGSDRDFPVSEAKLDGPRPVTPAEWAALWLDGDTTIGDVLRRYPLQEADRDDCRQRIWEEILATRLSKFRGGNFQAWIATLARNKAVDFLRKSRRAQASLTVELADDGTNAEPEAQKAPSETAHGLVWRALAELDDEADPRSYLVFFLHWIEGWPICQAGEVLGLEPGQARLRHHRFKKKFRKLVESFEG